MDFLTISVAAIILVSLIFYVLKGGADYGGGVWDLFSRGERQQKQSKLIMDSIAPIWEANHVWLILVIVILFTAFPRAFSVISVALHIPITLMLIGIIMRGSAYAFRYYNTKEDEAAKWGRVFSISSTITPVLLGVVLGAITSGEVIVRDYTVVNGYIGTWFKPYPFAVGIFTLCIFAYLAAVYLTVEAGDQGLREDFRYRAIISWILVTLMAVVVYLLSGTGTASIREEFTGSWWGLPLQSVTAFTAGVTLLCLVRRSFNKARFFAALQVTFIIAGWGFAQYPYIVEPDITIFNASAPVSTMKLLLAALAGGALVLFPSFYFIFRIFRKI